MYRSTLLGQFTLIRQPCEIGRNVSIGSYTEIAPECVIGSNVRIHSHCFIAERTVIEDDAWLGPGVITTNCWHPKCEFAKECMKGPHIGAGTIIGAGAIILPEVKIGAGALIGAGAIVAKNVDKGGVLYCQGARYMNQRSHVKCKKGRKRWAYD